MKKLSMIGLLLGPTFLFGEQCRAAEQVRSVAVDRAVLHQTIGQEQLLAEADILAGEDCLPRLGNHSVGYGRDPGTRAAPGSPERRIRIRT